MADENNDPFGVQYGQPLPTLDELDGMVNTATELSASLGTLLDEMDRVSLERRDELLAEQASLLDGLTQQVQGVGNVGPSPDAMASVGHAARAKAEAEAARFRQGVVKLHEKQTTEMMRRLNNSVERAAALNRTFPSPQSLLSVQRLGDPVRTQYHAQLQHAGPVELTTLARLALQTSDRALAAAVLAKNDQTPRDERKFSSADFARRVVGADHDKFVAAQKQLNSLFQSSRNRLWAMQTGKPLPGFEKVKQGLRVRDAVKAASQTKSGK